MDSSTAEHAAEKAQYVVTEQPTTTTEIPQTGDEVPQSPTQSHNGSARPPPSSSCSSYQTSALSGSDGRSYSSTIRHGEEPHEQFSQRVEKLCQILWPPTNSIKYRLSNSHAISCLRANKFLRPFVPSRQTPLLERLRGGDYNRILGVTLPPSYGVESCILILRVPREEGTRPDRAVALLNYVRKNTSIPVPAVIAKDFSSENPLEKPYVFLSRIPGSDLDRMWEELNHLQRCTVAHDLGGVIRTLLALETPFTGFLEAMPGITDTSESSSIVPFELKRWGQEVAEEIVPQTSVGIRAPRARQTTLDFFQTQLGRWRAAAVAELHECSTGYDVRLYDGMLKVTIEMAGLGLFKSEPHCLCHVDIHMGNVMAQIQSDNTLKVTAILDWDEAVFAPKFAACEPLGWLWGYIASDHLDEDDHLTWPYELEGANNVPSTPEQQELKRIFEEQAGPEYPHLAYDEVSRLCRGIFRIATEGLVASHYDKAAERILQEWNVLRQSLT